MNNETTTSEESQKPPRNPNLRYPGQRIGPMDLVKFYQICSLKREGLSEKYISELMGMSRQAVNYQVNLHDPLAENVVVTTLLENAEDASDEDAASLYRDAAKTILELLFQLKQHGINKAEEIVNR